MTTTQAAATAEDDIEEISHDRLLAALSGGEAPKRPGAIANSFTYGWRSLLKIKHVPEQLFDVTAFPILFTLLFTFLFGGALAGSPTEYLQFLLPGILVQTTVFITMYTGLTLATDIDKGMFDRFRSLPIWQPSPLVGAMLGDVVRFALACMMVLLVGVLLGFRPPGGVPGVLAGVVLILIFCFAVAWIWILIGLTVRSPNSVMALSMIVLFPLTFASNTFVDPATMPGWLQAFVNINPITYLVSAVRGFCNGDFPTYDVTVVLIISAVLVAIFGPLSMIRYRRR